MSKYGDILIKKSIHLQTKAVENILWASLSTVYTTYKTVTHKVQGINHRQIT